MADSGSEHGSIRLPLNSKRLTANHLRRLAAQLDVPTGASADELRQMIDGKLAEGGRDVMNVQVVLGPEPNSEFALEDEEGQFLAVPEAELEDPDDTPPSEGEHPREGEEEHPGREIESLREEKQSLRDQVSALQQKLEDEKTRFRDLWRTNCRCLTEYDALVSPKDGEIEELKSQLRSDPRDSPPLSEATPRSCVVNAPFSSG